MNKVKLLSSFFVILIGGFMFVYGEIDDSPGGQLIGLIVIIASVIGIIKRRKKD